MLKLIFVIVAMVTVEKVSGGGDGGGCSAAIQAAIARTQAFKQANDAKFADCRTELESQFEIHKKANATQNQFYNDLDPLVRGCLDSLGNIYGQFHVSLANDIGVSAEQLQQVFDDGSHLTPPISCVADFVKAASDTSGNLQSDFINAANGLKSQLTV